MSPTSFVRFVLVETHSLAKGLSGGRVRVGPRETVAGAIARRLAQDTRCEVVSLVEEAPVSGSAARYVATLRSARPREQGATRAEGTIRLRALLGG